MNYDGHQSELKRSFPSLSRVRGDATHCHVNNVCIEVIDHSRMFSLDPFKTFPPALNLIFP